MRATYAAIVAVALLLAACGIVGDELGGHVETAGEWQLEAGMVDGRALPVLVAHPVTLLVEADRVTGTAACNRYGGRLAASGSSFRVAELGGTAMGCEPAVLESETAFLQALGRVETAGRADDRLLLHGPGVQLRFLPLRPVDAGGLVAREWVLEGLVTGEVASAAAGEPATLLLREDGTMRGSTGCRTFVGRYVVEGGAVLVTELAMNGDCPDALADQDGHVVSVVGDGFRPVVEAGGLTLTDPGGLALRYRSAP